MLRLFCQNCNRTVEAVPVENPTDSVAGRCPDCGADLAAHRYIAPGTVINGFRVEREIGRGGMGVVYLAKQLDLDRDVALKVLSDEMASDAVFVEAFFREARAAAALNHPNIVQAIDAGTAENGLHYFVMELITGDNLELHTRQFGALDYDLAFKCATRIADALTFAWESKKLAHRDIKPENIIFTERQEFKLADLGLAKDYHDNTAESEDELMATPAYASPEVIRGEMDKIGFKSDMYSFGATLYQIFTGHPPFEGNDPAELCQKQLDEQPKPLIAIKPELPSRLSILIDRLMEKNPEKRPGSWSYVLHELNSIAVEWLRRKRQAEAELENVEEPQKSFWDSGTKLRLAIIGGLIFMILFFSGAIWHIKKTRASRTVRTDKKEIKVIRKQTTVNNTQQQPQQPQQQPETEPEKKGPAETDTAAENKTAITTEKAPAVEKKEPPRVVVTENTTGAFELLKKNLSPDPYQSWCEVCRFVKSRGNDAEQEEIDFLEELTKKYLEPFGEKLLNDIDDLTIKAEATAVQNDPDDLKALLDKISAVIKRAQDHQKWTDEICTGGELEKLERLKKYVYSRYHVAKNRENAKLQWDRKKMADYNMICEKLLTLSPEEIEARVDAWTQKYQGRLTDHDRSNAFHLKNLAQAKNLTLRKFLRNKSAAFYKQILFPETYPGVRYLRFSPNGKFMIVLDRDGDESRKKAILLDEREAVFLKELLMNPAALENLSITEKKMLINRAFFLKISREKFRRRICKTAEEEKMLFQDLYALPQSVLLR